MTTVLLKLFVKNYRDTSDTKVRTAYGSLSSAIGIFLNCLLCGFKIAVGYLAASAAMIADGANNLSDAGTCIIGFIGFKLAGKPADEKHPFGHGRYEYILSLIISFFVLLMGAELLKTAIEKMLHPQAVTYSAFFIAVSVASILVKLWMAIFNAKLAKTAGITALKAVSRDSLCDCAGTAAVLVAVITNQCFGWQIDAYIGAAVSLFVIWSGIGILKESLQPLLGKPADKDLSEKLQQFMCDFDPAILGVHDLILHDYGMGSIFAVAHAEVPADSDLVRTHEVIDSLEKAVGERFGISLVLHIDPVDTHDSALETLKAQVLGIVQSVDEHYTVHDFRLSPQGDKMYFDLVIDSDIKKDSAKIGEIVKARILAVLGEEIEPVINVEFSFSAR
ncbi:MAG: cation-efflux pump [Ruminococcaceae bacterium]|nr:cation-efflux pump [Oscillospiraceae bacterium]